LRADGVAAKAGAPTLHEAALEMRGRLVGTTDGPAKLSEGERQRPQETRHAGDHRILTVANSSSG